MSLEDEVLEQVKSRLVNNNDTAYKEKLSQMSEDEIISGLQSGTIPYDVTDPLKSIRYFLC